MAESKTVNWGAICTELQEALFTLLIDRSLMVDLFTSQA